MITQFSSLKLPLWDDHFFTLEGNSKITRSGGSIEEPAVNSFSLPSITCCPGSTAPCRSACYTVGMPEGVKAAHAFNAATLGNMLLAPARGYRASQILGDWIADNCSLSGFRWHTSGDVMHMRHASWIVDVCAASPKIEHWIYTRTLEAVGCLTLAENLVVNVSADEENYSEARAIALLHGCRICYLTRSGAVPDDLLPGSVIFPDYLLRGRALNDPTDHPWWQQLSHQHRRMVCPPDFFGQSEHLRCGPCTKCLQPLEQQR